MKYRIIFVFLTCLSSMLISGIALSDTNDESIAAKVINDGLNALEPKDVFVWAEMPKSAKLNSTIILKVEIQNLRTNKSFDVESIDLGENIGQGFKLKQVTPKPIELDTVLGEMTAEYKFSVEPGQTKQVIFEFVAIKEGVYKGDIDVWEGDNMLTRVAQCRIVK